MASGGVGVGGGGEGDSRPLKTIDTRHEDMIHDAQMDYYGKRLATCSSDRTVKVYDVSGEESVPIADLSGHEGPVWEVAWAHPKYGVLLASCSYDRQVIIHREVEGEWSPVYAHRSHMSSVNSIAWAPYECGLALACASSDGKVSVISHQDDNTWKTMVIDDCASGVNAVSWAPFNHLGSQSGGSTVMRIVTGGSDFTARIHTVTFDDKGACTPTGEAVVRLSAQHTNWVRDVAWVPSGGMPCNVIATCSEDCLAIIWKQLEAGGSWTPHPLPKFPAPVWRVSWSITGNILAVSCGDNTVTLWKETLTGEWEQVSSVEDPTPSAFAG